jgi:hypothetical protein
MKTKLFSKLGMMVVLLLPLLGRGLGGGTLFAQVQGNGISITNFEVAADATASTVTFDISWPDPAITMPAVWNDIVWVFADYNNAGTMTRLPLSGATLTVYSWSDATYTFADNNYNGVWIGGNAKDPNNTDGTFSARVQLFSATTFVSGACAFAINYPPVGQYAGDRLVALHGTPPYTLTFAGDEGNPVEVSRELAGGATPYPFPDGKALASFHDRSRAPGSFSYVNPVPPVIERVSAATVCNNTTLTFRVPSPSAGLSYTWSNNITGAVVGYSGAGSHTVTITTTAATGLKTVTAKAWYEVGSNKYESSGVSNSATVYLVAVPGSPAVPSTSSPVCPSSALTVWTARPTNATALTWTGSPTGSTTGTGAVSYTLTTPSGTNKLTFTVQAYREESGIKCYSSDKATKEVTPTGPPVITWNAGTGNRTQSVQIGKAINTMVATVSNATATPTLSGTAMDGVNYNAVQASINISGYPKYAPKSDISRTITYRNACPTTTVATIILSTTVRTGLPSGWGIVNQWYVNGAVYAAVATAGVDGKPGVVLGTFSAASCGEAIAATTGQGTQWYFPNFNSSALNKTYDGTLPSTWIVKKSGGDPDMGTFTGTTFSICSTMDGCLGSCVLQYQLTL